jgi:hypothetical protein
MSDIVRNTVGKWNEIKEHNRKDTFNRLSLSVHWHDSATKTKPHEPQRQVGQFCTSSEKQSPAKYYLCLDLIDTS